MSMIGNLRTVDDGTIEALVEDPGLVVPLLYGPAALGPATPPPSLLGKVLGFDRSSPASKRLPEGMGAAPGEGRAIDVDKAWHGIHYLLTGTAEECEGPLALFLAGGSTLGDVDVGYGPARAFDSGAVRTLARCLEDLSPEDLARRYDPAALRGAEVYPDIWDDPEDDSCAYLLEHYRGMRDFVLAASKAGMGLLVYLD